MVMTAAIIFYFFCKPQISGSKGQTFDKRNTAVALLLTLRLDSETSGLA